MNTFGSWREEAGLPVFCETVHPGDAVCWWDPQIGPQTNRHWSGFGNRRYQVIADNFGTTAIWDAHCGLDWVTASEPGTGATIISVDGAARWATDLHRWPPTWTGAGTPTRIWGPTWFTITGTHDGIRVQRMLGCPDGELPYVLINVTLTSDHDVVVDVGEEWRFAPRSIPIRLLRQPEPEPAAPACTTVTDRHGVDILASLEDTLKPLIMRLQSVEPLDDIHSDGHPTPTVRLVRRLTLTAGRSTTCWFVLGTGSFPADPAAQWQASVESLHARLPSAQSPRVPAISREAPWHAALLTGGACVDGILGGHLLDQASAYSFHLGFNGAARDPLQHALPLVYCEPDLALSVLRNVSSWGGPDGELPYGLHGRREQLTDTFQPSDTALWSLWLATEYAAVTGDLDAFAAATDFHRRHHTPPIPLVEHLVGHYRHLVDVVGVGERGHIRIKNADWNDSALVLSPVDRTVMQAAGESVLNSAMAAWVLPRFAGLLRRIVAAPPDGLPCDHLGAVADDADRRAEHWRQLVAEEWNGRWFNRAHGPGAVVGDDECWLEVQPWAILSGAATPEQAIELLATIDDVLRRDSPLGARLRGPTPIRVPPERIAGEGTAGGIWYSINMTLAWAARDVDPDLAWDELDRMMLATHTAEYPSIWEGTISGPDSYNAPESPRPGATWAWRKGNVAMQTFPVTNLHAHSQVLLTFMRLLGVEPTVDGELRVAGGGGSFRSRTFEVDIDGHGRAETVGEIRVASRFGDARGSGSVRW